MLAPRKKPSLLKLLYDGNGEFKDILFDNIDIENFLGKYKDCRREPTRAFFMEILNRNDGVGPVHDVTIRNINFRNKADSDNLLNSLNRVNCFSDIHFQNIIYCNMKFESVEEIFKKTDFARDITVE